MSFSQEGDIYLEIFGILNGLKIKYVDALKVLEKGLHALRSSSYANDNETKFYIGFLMKFIRLVLQGNFSSAAQVFNEMFNYDNRGMYNLFLDDPRMTYIWPGIQAIFAVLRAGLQVEGYYAGLVSLTGDQRRFVESMLFRYDQFNTDFDTYFGLEDTWEGEEEEAEDIQKMLMDGNCKCSSVTASASGGGGGGEDPDTDSASGGGGGGKDQDSETNKLSKKVLRDIKEYKDGTEDVTQALRDISTNEDTENTIEDMADAVTYFISSLSTTIVDIQTMVTTLQETQGTFGYQISGLITLLTGLINRIITAASDANLPSSDSMSEAVDTLNVLLTTLKGLKEQSEEYIDIFDID